MYQSIAAVFFISYLVVMLLFALLGVISSLLCAAVYFIALSLCIVFLQPLQNKIQMKLSFRAPFSIVILEPMNVFMFMNHYHGAHHKWLKIGLFIFMLFLKTYGIIAFLYSKFRLKKILQAIKKQFNKQ